MKYMLLIYGDPTADVPSGPVPDGVIEDWAECSQAMAEAGVLVSGDGLQGADTATTVRLRDGERLVVDGPFSETKELLLGYYVLDTPSVDEAIAWAARLPTATWGTTEVRPVMIGPASAENFEGAAAGEQAA